MNKKIMLSILGCAQTLFVFSQKIEPKEWQVFPDSTIVSADASYNNVTGFHKFIWGKNFRADWAMPVKIPVLKISEINGGLTPIRQGGGMETKSIRLKDKYGREWVLRNVEKAPDKLLPEGLQGTFAIDWVGDEFSAQHPYSALVMPPLADAAGVPHAHPVIGYVAADTALGEFAKIVVGRVCLLEEREPTGYSENTINIEADILKNNENRFDGAEFVRARMLDMLVGDWDRHEDQWRWTSVKDGKSKFYTAVPRDRDQVFHVNQGVLPVLYAMPGLDPVIGNFDTTLNYKYGMYKSRFMRAYGDSQFSYEEWMKMANDFVQAENDQVLEAGLRCLPKEMYEQEHDVLLTILKKRRDKIPAAMSRYYLFINQVVDIRATDKDELFTLTDAADGAVHVDIDKLDKTGKAKSNYLNIVYNPKITRELRIYTSGGDDRIVVNVTQSPIKIRFIDSTGNKSYVVKHANRTINIYGPENSTQVSGELDHVSTHFSNDTLNTRFVPANLYNKWLLPLATASYNADDGFLLGLGFRYRSMDGFRKLPYATQQDVMITHSFETKAFRLKYNGEWIQVIGKADFTLEALIHAPDNTINFFGRGNETVLNKEGDYHKYYRTRFDYYELNPALRWHTGKNSIFSFGPSLQYYNFNNAANTGRIIENTSMIHSYDSLTINTNKLHLGLRAIYETNQRDNNMLPKKGYFFYVSMVGYDGLNSNSRSFFQVKPEFTYYQALDTSGSVVLSDRLGGGISVGSPAFYQSMFLGGQGNLLGYLQNRFAGQDMIFNNFQARVKLANIASYILPGQLGLSGFFDAGRVWVPGEQSNTIHTGTGGGFYFVPASLTVIQVLVGHSNEGWYPYISMNFRL